MIDHGIISLGILSVMAVAYSAFMLLRRLDFTGPRERELRMKWAVQEAVEGVSRQTGRRCPPRPDQRMMLDHRAYGSVDTGFTVWEWENLGHAEREAWIQETDRILNRGLLRLAPDRILITEDAPDLSTMRVPELATGADGPPPEPVDWRAFAARIANSVNNGIISSAYAHAMLADSPASAYLDRHIIHQEAP